MSSKVDHQQKKSFSVNKRTMKLHSNGDLKQFLSGFFFTSIQGIGKYHHFICRYDKPGIFIVKEKCNELKTNILRRIFEQFGPLAPEVIPAVGISRARQEYLYKKNSVHLLGRN